MNNPFQTARYAGAKYFCDRQQETKTLLKNISNNISTTLISHRRIGKTGLIHHVMEKAGKSTIIVYIDILATENKNQLLDVLASAIASAVDEQSSFGKKVWKFLKSLRPVISFDLLSGKPKMSIESKPDFIDSNIESLFMFLDKQAKKFVLAMDEFQQITAYPEKNVDAFLRSICQRSKNLCFIFSGSKKHLMHNLFTDPSKPFYRSTAILNLGKIPKTDYIPFIQNHFNKGGFEISLETISDMIDWADGFTYYVQLLCSRVYANSKHKVTASCWQNEAENLLVENEPVFFNYRDILTKNQWELLKAASAELKVKSPTSSEFISKYSLGSSASVLRSLQALLSKEMLYYDYDDKGQKYYSVYDLLLQRYLQKIK